MVKKPNNSSIPNISTEEKKQLIKGCSLFSLLNSDDIDELASYTTITSLSSGTTIVNEGEIVDSFHIIQSGSAEVLKTTHTLEKKETHHIMELNAGETIGISETVFFSSTGIRKATVVANSDIVLLTINIKNFHDFLCKPGITYPALKNVGDKLLLMNILKSISVFDTISNEQIRQLVEGLKRNTIRSGDILFNMGDPADGCYILLSGTLNIISTDDNKKNQVSKLHAPILVGEAAFFDKTVRSVTAEALTEADIAFISQEDVKQLLKDNNIIVKPISVSQIKQIKPIPNPHVIVQKQEENDHVILKNTENNSIMTLSSEEYNIWKICDGHHSLHAIHNHFSNLSLQEIYTFTLKLSLAGLFGGITPLFLPVHSTLKQQVLSWIHKLWTVWK